MEYGGAVEDESVIIMKVQQPLPLPAQIPTTPLAFLCCPQSSSSCVVAAAAAADDDDVDLKCDHQYHQGLPLSTSSRSSSNSSSSSSSSSNHMSTSAMDVAAQSWFSNSGLPSDIIVHVDDMLFHLHKDRISCRSGKLLKLIMELDGSACTAQLQCRVAADNTTAHGAPARQNHDSSHVSVRVLCLHGMPGGAKAFEAIAKWCYGGSAAGGAEITGVACNTPPVLTAGNVAALRCAAEYLEMHDLVASADSYLDHAVLTSWEASLCTLKSCESFLSDADDLLIVSRCVESITSHVILTANSEVTSLIPTVNCSTGDQLRHANIKLLPAPAPAAPEAAEAAWYKELSVLSLPLFTRVISSLVDKGSSPESIVRALMHYANKSIPGLVCNGIRRSAAQTARGHIVLHSNTRPADPVMSRWNSVNSLSIADIDRDQQLDILESIEKLLPSSSSSSKDVANAILIPTHFLCSLLKMAMVLGSSPACQASLERRVAAQLHNATLDDLLIASYSADQTVLYDVERMHRILEYYNFMSMTTADDLNGRNASGNIMLTLSSDDESNMDVHADEYTRSSMQQQQVEAVVALMDAYLGEVASDSKLGAAQFCSLVGVLPAGARQSADGLYRAIDIFLRSHRDSGACMERERLCEALDFAKLSPAACSHAARNERLPLRAVLAVLHMEQSHLRRAVHCFTTAAAAAAAATAAAAASALHGSPSHDPPPDHSLVVKGSRDVIRPLPPSPVHDQPPPIQGPIGSNEDLKMDLQGLRRRICVLERECSSLRHRLGRKMSGWSLFSSKLLGCRSVAEISETATSSLRSHGSSARFPLRRPVDDHLCADPQIVPVPAILLPSSAKRPEDSEKARLSTHYHLDAQHSCVPQLYSSCSHVSRPAARCRRSSASSSSSSSSSSSCSCSSSSSSPAASYTVRPLTLSPI